MIEVNDIRARMGRLDELARGLSREVALWRGAESPLLQPERRAYLNAMQDLLASAERARTALNKALLRIEERGRAAQPPAA